MPCLQMKNGKPSHHGLQANYSLPGLDILKNHENEINIKNRVCENWMKVVLFQCLGTYCQIINRHHTWSEILDLMCSLCSHTLPFASVTQWQNTASDAVIDINTEEILTMGAFWKLCQQTNSVHSILPHLCSSLSRYPKSSSGELGGPSVAAGAVM